MFANDCDRAVAYAAMKSLERMLSDDGELPPGFSEDVSGYRVTITLPQGSLVERDAGSKGDGTVQKTAVQNLYGYALWALMVHRLRKFNQWNKIRESLIDAMREVIRRPGKNLRDEILKEYPDLATEIESIQNELKIPSRTEATPRIFKAPDLPVTVTIQLK